MIMELNIKVKKVQLLITHGTDLINITIDGESSFPIMKYPTIMKIECQKGYGKEYCENVLGLTPEVLDVT
jgi:hypothetical protein